MSIYGYTYDNGITSGVVFIEKTGSTWTAQVTNGCELPKAKALGLPVSRQ